jgi:hypothetical protein
LIFMDFCLLGKYKKNPKTRSQEFFKLFINLYFLLNIH